MFHISINIYHLSQLVKNDILLSMINSDFSQKSFVMLYVKNVCKYLFIFTLIFAIGEKRHIVEYDKLRFQPEMICNAVCEECLQISIYIYPLFSQMVSQNMLLSMINSYFSDKSFVMLYVKNVCKYLFIFTHLFSQLVKNDILLSMINSDFSQKSFVMLYVKNVCKYLFIFTHNSLKWFQTTCC